MTEAFVCSAAENVVETEAGRVRGYTYRGVHTFHGIRYARARRFHSPQPPAHWEGVVNAFDYGAVTPQLRGLSAKDSILSGGYAWVESEDCHFLNVWSPDLCPGEKKPVMVWVHGGGYTSGSGNMAREMDGTNLSRDGDVVVVSFNHRLSVFGCLDLSALDDRYANSGNLVMEDIVAALAWVRRNIAAFGGDPENVTLFGHSSGGAKIANLLQIPAADGLYHKAIIQTGIIPASLQPDPESSRRFSEALLQVLGIDRDHPEAIEEVPTRQIMDACPLAAEILKEEDLDMLWGVHTNDYYIGDPRVVGFREQVRSIPILTGTTIGEFGPLDGFPGRDLLRDDELEERLRLRYGDGTEQVKALFREAYPDKDLSVLLCLDSHTRTCAFDFLDAAESAGCRAMYAYQLTYSFPFMGGMPTWHGAEIPLVFGNTGCIPLYDGDPQAKKLSDEMMSAWVTFARTGAPDWPAYTASQRSTMVFDTQSACRMKHDDALVRYIQQNMPVFT